MNHRILAFLSVLATAISVLVVAGIPIAGQVPFAAGKTAPGPKTWNPPRTPDGQPDLQGIWTNATLTPLERPSELAGKRAFSADEALAYEKQVLQQRNED